MIIFRYSANNDKDDLLAREIIQENTGEKDPELSLASDFLDEVELRLEQVKIYYPIVDLLKKRKTDDEFLGFIPELCFLLLSFLIYEGKLKHRGISFEEIDSFLYKVLKGILPKNIEQDVSRKLAIDLLDALQNGGRNFVLNIYSFKTGGFKEKYVKFLDIKQSEEGTLRYFITEQGVDFFLKTKEFPDETKITINLLLFQKQMEKGAFGFAYETVRRLNMEVQKKKDRKYSLLEALMYGRLDFGEAYNSYHQSIVMQFEEESELFNSAIKNVRNAFNEYVDRISSGTASEKEIRTFTLVKIIEKEISLAQTLHTELLREAVGFTKEYDKVLGVRRKAIFTERFSFQGEFEKLVSRNERPETLKYLFEPLINPNIKKSFNPLRAFEPQRILKSKQEDKESIESDINAERLTMDDKTRNRVRANFIFYAAELLQTLDNEQLQQRQLQQQQPLQQPKQHQIFLHDFCSYLVEKHSEDSIYNGDFLSFIVEINRDKKVGETSRVINFANIQQLHGDSELKTIEEVFYKAAISLNIEDRIKQVMVKSFPEEELELLPGLKITKMLFTGDFKP